MPIHGKPEPGLLERGAAGELGRTVSAQLNADMAVALFHEALHVVHHLADVAARGVGIAVHGEARLAAEQLINGHSGAFAFDVPERLIESAEGVVENGTVAPVRAGVGGLPDVLDVVGVAPAAERVEVFLNGGFHRERALVERGAAQAVQAGFAGLDLHDDHAHARLGRGEDGSHAGDLERRVAAGRASGGNLSGRGGRRGGERKSD